MKKAILMIFFITQIGGITMAEEAVTNNKADYSEFTDNELIKKNPKLTPTQAVTGALRVVRALSQGAKISPELVKAQIGIVLKQRGNYKSNYYHYSELNNDWSYMYEIFFKEGTPLKYPPPTRFKFDFSKRRGNKKHDMSTICEIDLATIHNILLELGFNYKGLKRAGILYEDFESASHYISIGIYSESKEKPKHDCMYTLMISEREIKK